METQEVRYGDERLVVGPSGSLAPDSNLGSEIERYDAGDTSADALALTYLKTRVVEHSDGFTWDGVDVDELLRTITEQAPEPGIDSASAWELAGALLELRETAPAVPSPAPAPAAAVEPPAPAPAATVEPTSSPAPGLAPTAAPTTSPAKTQAGSSATGGKAARVSAVAGGMVAGARATGRGARRVLPKRTRTRIALGLGILLLVGLALGINHYLSDVPDQLADDYRERAQPATEEITDSMDRAYAAFDTYLGNSTLPARELRNAEEFSEIQRRLLPLYDDTEDALDTAEKAIKSARKAISKERESFGDVPSAPLLGEKRPVVAAEASVEETEAYLRQAGAFLKNFDRFVKFDQKALELRREEVKSLGANEVDPDADLEEAKAATVAELKLAEESREAYLDLEPHPDQEKLFDVYIESATISVDYFEDLVEAYDNLSLVQFEAAGDELFDSLKSIRGKESYLLGVFAADSSLQKQSRKVGRLGDDLEREIARLGTGDGDPIRPDLYRPAAPPAPKPPDKGGSSGGGDEGSLS